MDALISFPYQRCILRVAGSFRALSSKGKNTSRHGFNAAAAVNARCGFTLMELLVVITIISVLASLLLVSVRMVRDSAASSVCSSNLRQMQLANIQYSVEYPEEFIGKSCWSTSLNAPQAWFYNVDWQSYLNEGRKGVAFPPQLLCPVAKPGVGWSPVGFSYGYNVPSIALAAPPFSNPLTGLPGIGGKVAFADALGYDLSYAGASPSVYWVNGSPAPEGIFRSHSIAYRHGKSANAAFFDGHVAHMSWQDLYVPTNFN